MAERRRCQPIPPALTKSARNRNEREVLADIRPVVSGEDDTFPAAILGAPSWSLIITRRASYRTLEGPGTTPVLLRSF